MLNLRWFFEKLHVAGRYGSLGRSLVAVNDVLFVLAFFTARIVFGTWNVSITTRYTWSFSG